MSKKNSIIKGALYLSIAGIITRLLGFVYRIYLSRLVGTEGIGLYQLVIPVYLVCHTTCTTGIFISCSKMIAAENGKGTVGNSKKILTTATTISVIMACLIGGGAYLLSGFIANDILHEPRIHNCVKILALSLPLTSLVSMSKAFFYGIKASLEPSISQLLEQIVKMVITYFVALNFADYPLSFVCMLVVLSMIVSEIVSGLFDFICFSIKTRKFKSAEEDSYIPELAKLAAPLTLNRLLITLLSSIEVILIPLRLQKYGLSASSALQTYGILTGMAFPLVFFPSVFTGALSMLLLPTVAEAQAANKDKALSYATSKTIQISLIVGIYACGMFLFFGQSLGLLTFNSRDVGQYLIILAWLCPFMYIETTFASIINGLGKTFVTFRNSLISAITKILFIYFLIPVFGIKAYLWGLLIGHLLSCLLNLHTIKKHISLEIGVGTVLIKPIISVIASGLLFSLIYRIFTQQFGEHIITILAIALLMMLLYLVLLILTKAIKISDLRKIKKM